LLAFAVLVFTVNPTPFNAQASPGQTVPSNGA